jgi:predicted metal-dependent enzyme (double-stranded beta helix superfamily)
MISVAVLALLLIIVLLVYMVIDRNGDDTFQNVYYTTHSRSFMKMYPYDDSGCPTEPPVPAPPANPSSKPTIAKALPQQNLGGNSVTLDLSTFFNYASYYSVSADTTTPTDLKLINGSMLTVSGAFRNKSYNVTVVATNAQGSVSQSFSVVESAPPAPNPKPTVTSSIPTQNIGGNSVVLDLKNFFNFAVSFTVTADKAPTDLKLINGSMLTVTGAFRNTSYSVTVVATNAQGSASQSFSVVESAPSQPGPSIAKSIPQQNIGGNSVVLDMNDYFKDAMMYTVSSAQVQAADLAGSKLTVRGAFRNTTYSVTVSATNARGTVSQTFSVSESAAAPPPAPLPPPPAVLKSIPDQNLGNANVATINLNEYFSNGVTYSASTTQSPTVLSVNGSTLTLTGASRNTTYSVTVVALNAQGSISQTFKVTESALRQPIRIIRDFGVTELTLKKGETLTGNIRDYIGGDIQMLTVWGYGSTINGDIFTIRSPYDVHGGQAFDAAISATDFFGKTMSVPIHING